MLYFIVNNQYYIFNLINNNDIFILLSYCFRCLSNMISKTEFLDNFFILFSVFSIRVLMIVKKIRKIKISGEIKHN